MSKINFERFEYQIRDKVKLNYNPCSEYCKCYWNKKKASYLSEDREYEIEDISYFGGGCPPVLLHLKGVKETKKSDKNWGVPANWFKTTERDGKVKAFAFAAGEFLDEKIEELQNEYGEDLEFFTKGKYIENKGTKHPHEWWTTQKGCDELNKLIKEKNDVHDTK